MKISMWKVKTADANFIIYKVGVGAGRSPSPGISGEDPKNIFSVTVTGVGFGREFILEEPELVSLILNFNQCLTEAIKDEN